jgi:hypothetical protein
MNEPRSKHHVLKILPQFYDDILNRGKRFEIRNNDRDFQAGDTATLYLVGNKNNTLEIAISYVSSWNQKDGYVVFSFVLINKLKESMNNCPITRTCLLHNLSLEDTIGHLSACVKELTEHVLETRKNETPHFFIQKNESQNEVDPSEAPEGYYAVKCKNYDGCNGCALTYSTVTCSRHSCTYSERRDKCDVIFVKKEVEA